tara:strand:- start:57 stop:227 length:171 start_codon:yes stop_codon:yes gene_type:complete
MNSAAITPPAENSDHQKASFDLAIFKVSEFLFVTTSCQLVSRIQKDRKLVAYGYVI